MIKKKKKPEKAVGKVAETVAGKAKAAGTVAGKAEKKLAMAPKPSQKSSQMKLFYEEEVIPLLKQKLGIKNRYAAPKIQYVKVNVGIGSYVSAGKDHEEIIKNVAKITGQKPVMVKSKKSISNFKLKIGMPVGVSVTLRGRRMYEFLSKLINAVLPRIRDFRGISPLAFDGRGNYSFGISEHIVFPEIDPEDISKIHGLQITIVTSAKTNEQGLELLKTLKFPFKL